MRLISGEVDHGRCSVDVLPREERESGWFLSCQARALSDLTVELTTANKYRVLTAWPYGSVSDALTRPAASPIRGKPRDGRAAATT